MRGYEGFMVRNPTIALGPAVLPPSKPKSGSFGSMSRGADRREVAKWRIKLGLTDLPTDVFARP